MAEFVQLDRAAVLVGKSEVTLRRLIKAGKIPFQREKTLTGFIYLVDPDTVRTHYRGRGISMPEDPSESEEDTQSDTTEDTEPVYSGRTTTSSTVRVAVADESGSMVEYWQKRADRYEEKYSEEASRHSHTREELGAWRGRAEQAQAMLVKLLPSGDPVVVEPPVQSVSRDGVPAWVGMLIALVTVLVIGGLVYLFAIAPNV